VLFRSTPAARAALNSVFTFGMEATQRGLRCGLQLCWLKSSIRSAVVFRSIVTGFNPGGGGACTDVHSSMIVSACADCTMMQLANPAMVALSCHKMLCPVDIAFLPVG